MTKHRNVLTPDQQSEVRDIFNFLIDNKTGRTTELEFNLANEWLIECVVRVDGKIDTYINQIRLTVISLLTLTTLALRFLNYELPTTSTINSISLLFFVIISAIVIIYSLTMNNVDHINDYLVKLKTDEGRIEFAEANNSRLEIRNKKLTWLKVGLFFSTALCLVVIFTTHNVPEVEKQYVTRPEFYQTTERLENQIRAFHDKTGFITGSDVHLRSSPNADTDENIIEVTSRGDYLFILKTQDGWTKIQVLNSNYSESEGWVKSEFIVRL
tara:strand:- start:1595 stop:2404 length:810 start_codon:yes stop_codon:yes gene_type:complete